MRTRREILAATAAAVVMPRVAFAQAEPPKPKQLIFNASGGSQIASLRENYLNDFEKETGIKIVDTSPVDFGKLRAMVESGNVVLEYHRDRRPGRLPRHRDGSCRADRCQDRRSQQIPAAGADEPRVLAELLFDRDVLPAGCVSQGRAEIMGRFLGRQGVSRAAQHAQSPRRQSGSGADGRRRDAGQLYPLDVDRAFKKLDAIHKHINVWWSTGQQPAQLLVDKEVVLATGWNGRFYDLIRKEAPLAMEWNGGILKQGSWVVPKGAKDQYWAMKVLATMSDPKRQAANAEILGYSGMHLDSNQYVAEKIRPLLPLYPDNLKKQLWLDQKWWTINGAEIGERWNKWMLSKA